MDAWALTRSLTRSFIWSRTKTIRFHFAKQKMHVVRIHVIKITLSPVLTKAIWNEWYRIVPFFLSEKTFLFLIDFTQKRLPEQNKEWTTGQSRMNSGHSCSCLALSLRLLLSPDGTFHNSSASKTSVDECWYSKIGMCSIGRIWNYQRRLLS